MLVVAKLLLLLLGLPRDSSMVLPLTLRSASRLRLPMLSGIRCGRTVSPLQLQAHCDGKAISRQSGRNAT